MANASHSILIKGTKKKAYDVVMDFKHYPAFLPEMKRVVIEKKKGNVSVVTFTVQVVKEINYTLEITGKPHEGMHWTLVKGDMMKSNVGGWTLEDSGKHAVKATYEVDIDIGLLIPAALTKALVSKDLPTMMKRFKERVEGT